MTFVLAVVLLNAGAAWALALAGEHLKGVFFLLFAVVALLVAILAEMRRRS